MKPPPGKPRTISIYKTSPALLFSVGYALVGCIWLAASSQLHGILGISATKEFWLETSLGVLFVAVSAYLIFSQLNHRADNDSNWDDHALTVSSPIERPSLLVIVIIVLSICGIGLTVYLAVKKQIAIGATGNLESISRLKVSQINAWLDEARSDTRLTVNSNSFKAELRTWLENGKREDKFREYLLTRLKDLTSLGHFHDVSLYDLNGALLITTKISNKPERINRTVIEAVVRGDSGDSIIDDFHLSANSGSKDVVVGLFSPVQLDAASKPIAILHASLAPEKLLYPLLQQWPGTSSTAETLLIRRDGDNALFLNTLRHRKDPPLSLKLPLSTPDLLSSNVLKGQNGAISGVDYRNKPCLAFSLPVPGTSWHILSKIDEAEVDATLNSLARFAVGMVTIQLLIAGLWLRNYYRAMEARNRAQAERMLLSNRIETLVRHANDCIIMFDENNRIIDANDRCLNTYGYTREEMLSLNSDKLLANAKDDPSQGMRRLEDKNSHLPYVTHHRRKNSSVFPVEISQVAMEVGGVRRTQQIIRDISEREISNARIVRLSQLYATLSALNQAIARSTDIETVFRTACHACVEHGGLVLSWIGLQSTDGEFLTVDYSCGKSVDYLEERRISPYAHKYEGRSLAGIAFSEQRVYVCNDFAKDPVTQPWRDRAAQFGICSAIALPIGGRNEVVTGVLTAYSDKTNFFDDMVEHLFKEIADSLSFAMHHFDENKVKLKVEKELRQSEELLQEAQVIARIGHWQYELETETCYWSPQMYHLYERDPAWGPASIHDIDLYYAPESAQLATQGVHKALLTGQRIELELQVRLHDNQIAYQAAVIIPVCNDQGVTTVIRGTIQDITEHKLSEQELQQANRIVLESAQEVEDLYQNAPCGYHSLDANGVFRRINETELRWLGYSRDELIGKMRLQDLLIQAHAQRFDRTFPRLIETGEINDVELDILCKDGRRLPVLVNATAIRDGNGCFLMSRSTLYNMTERKKMENERLEYSKRLEHLSRRLVSSQETGRRELSAALHDQTSPNLSAIEINLNVISKLIQANQSPEVAAILDDTFALLKDTTMSIRDVCAELRPSLLDYAGLLPALEGYANQFSRRTGTTVRIRCPNPTARLAPDKESMLFRIVQEAMTNCAKHANATSIEVALNQTGNTLVLTVADNGIGFNPEQLGKNGEKIGLGVLNMKEISEFIGGRFTIESSPGRGTSISVKL